MHARSCTCVRDVAYVAVCDDVWYIVCIIECVVVCNVVRVVVYYGV